MENKACRLLLAAQIKQLDPQTLFKALTQPADLYSTTGVFRVDKAYRLRMLGHVPLADIDDTGILNHFINPE